MNIFRRDFLRALCSFAGFLPFSALRNRKLAHGDGPATISIPFTAVETLTGSGPFQLELAVVWLALKPGRTYSLNWHKLKSHPLVHYGSVVIHHSDIAALDPQSKHTCDMPVACVDKGNARITNAGTLFTAKARYVCLKFWGAPRVEGVVQEEIA